MTYGHPQGLAILREFLAEKLTLQGMPCNAEDILLTQGATHALDIVCSTLRLDNSPVLIDNPGYCNLLSALRFRGCQLLAVNWTPYGPDLQQLEALMQQYRPRVFFTNPWLHNPTGASYAPHIAHGVLRLAQQYDVLLVEDNVSADLMAQAGPTLAAMDGLRNVMHIGSFSKALSPALRVGYLLAPARWQATLTRAKMLAALTSSTHTERLAYELACDSKYKRQNARLIERIAQSTSKAVARFEQQGWEVFQPASKSMFIWAKPPHGKTIDQETARQQKIFLAPGTLFSSDGEASAYYRFNAAYLDHTLFWQWLAQQ
jgi:DNA-binding transcriptional MocR family regulator